MILLAAEQKGVPVNELAPAEIKKAVVGTGAASKKQVQFMLTKLLRLKAVPQPTDAADGGAAAPRPHWWNAASSARARGMPGPCACAKSMTGWWS